MTGRAARQDHQARFQIARADRFRDDSTQRLAEMEQVVFSTTLESTSRPNTRICRDDLIGEVTRRLRDSDVPLRTMGSRSVARQLLGAGLVDRLRLMTFPLLVGSPRRGPFFADAASADRDPSAIGRWTAGCC